jgi:dGTPase
VEDAITAGLVSLDDFLDVELVSETVREIRQSGKMANSRALVPTLIRKLIDTQVADLIAETTRKIRSAKVENLKDIRARQDLLVGNSQSLTEKITQLEKFLRERVYFHYRVQRMATRGRRILKRLFDEFCRVPKLLPGRYQGRLEAEGLKRVICDYLAGMTDQFAISEYQKLFDPGESV